MIGSRRQIAQLAAVAVALGVLAGQASAQPFPPPEYPPVLYGPDGQPSAICVPRYWPDGTLRGWKYACGADYSVTNAAADCARRGDLLYRMGTLGQSTCGESQYWFTRANHPLRLNPVTDLGFPANHAPLNSMCTGRLIPGTPFVSRPYAMGNGVYDYRVAEIICPSGGVRLETFHTGVVPHEEEALDYCGPGRRLARGRPAPPICGTPTSPPPLGPGGRPVPWWRPTGPMDANQMCNGAIGVGTFGPLAYGGGVMTVNGLASCANDNPAGAVEATAGTLLMTTSTSCALYSGGTFLTGAGFTGGGAALTTGGGAVATVALPATACVAVGTAAYCGTRYVDNASGGRISDGVATGLCAVGDTFANGLWRWWMPGCECNYELTRTSAGMFGEGARCQQRGPSPVRCGGNVRPNNVDPPYEGAEGDDDLGGCTAGPGAGAGFALVLGVGALVLGRRPRRSSRAA
ncbi:MAG TPA: hypothetical protein VFT22_25385 [Kofleriaceae bacterium]|nr:hypothetical protein [Kofleriaceae bacterium]